MHTAFRYPYYLIKRQILALTGKLRIYGPQGQLLLFSEQKMFRLKEDLRIFSDDSKSQELLRINARQVIDFAAAYDVTDSLTGESVGVLRRKGFKSWVRDEWEILDPRKNIIGTMVEDSMAQALLRRMLLGNLLPQNYDIIVSGKRAADIRQRFNLLRYELEIMLPGDSSGGGQPVNNLDPRLAISAGILLAIIEGRQD